MTRLEGTQTLFGGQLGYGNVKLSLNQTANMASGGDGGNAVGWIPGGSAFVTHSLSREFKVGFGIAGAFGGSVKYDDDWAGRYYGREADLLGMSLLPSVAYRVNDNLSLGASLNAMYGKTKTVVSINNIVGADGQLKVEDTEWGWGANLGLLYEVRPGTRIGLTWNSQVDLDFKAPLEFSGLAPGLSGALGAAGLLNATIDLGIKVPQGVMGSFFHQMNERWAVLGSVGWQQWSKFGKIDVSVDSSNPTSVTTNIPFKDTWHVALGAQHRLNADWLLNFGVAYDSKFQDGNNVSPMLPTNTQWRFGAGAQKPVNKGFTWGVAAEYLYGGTLDVNKQSAAPVAAGGRGNLSGSYNNTGVFFVSANASWKF
jgi:long-chain fatty acid transport protein